MRQWDSMAEITPNLINPALSTEPGSRSSSVNSNFPIHGTPELLPGKFLRLPPVSVNKEFLFTEQTTNPGSELCNQFYGSVNKRPLIHSKTRRPRG